MNRRNFLGKSALTNLLAVGSVSSLFASGKPKEKNNYKNYRVAIEVDVLVCGGGCSGVVTAISAARHGAKVALIERLPSIGGMATNGLVNAWHTSDREKLVILGLVEESGQRLLKGNWVIKDLRNNHSHETYWFEPEGARIVWQQMLREAGVRTFCYLAVGEPIVEGNQVKGILADTKTGRKAFLGKIVIDCTGDGDIAANAGLPFSYGRESDELVQGMTMCFTLRGLDVPMMKTIPNDQLDQIMNKMEQLRKEGKMPPFNAGNTRALLRGAWGNFFPWNMCPVAGNPLDEEELTRLTEISREQILQYIDFWKKDVPGMETAKLDQTACSLGIRESRRVKGLNTLDKDMVLEAVKQPDAVGHGVWMLDIHDPKGSGYTTFTDQNTRTMLKAGTSYHIPLGIALNDRFHNLAVPCRAASTTHQALASFRVQSHLMVLSQGVGTCAAMALDANTTMDKVDIKELQKVLKADGVYLEDVPQKKFQ
ncbi:MAG: FAD-dependent oxidoreductase [Prolixibacteraceae bacterium]|jgi:hypothetical protein|nr:FAD-dependent oxidoreductase [Prolixibacteraceae bacterium]